ncbi:MAG: hypothetical protein FWC43_08050 [Planctomycetaceae bacterium]|nr:hypothetical protein [Planctomycetaceae bacterium]
MNLTHFCKTISGRYRIFDVMKGWKTSLREDFEPFRSYFRPLDRFARMYPGEHENELYRIVIHRNGSIVGVDDEDVDNRIELTQSDIILYEFNLDLFRDSLCEALGLQPSRAPIPEIPRVVSIGSWEPEKSARFPVSLLLPGTLNLRDKVFERIAEKTEFAEIFLAPPRSRWDDTLCGIAKKHNILLVPLDEVICLGNRTICPTPFWSEYLAAFCQMVDVALPSKHRKKVRSYVFARRDDAWFLQYEETTSKLELELLGPPFIQHLLKYPDRPIHVRELWGEVMGRGTKRKKVDPEFAETHSLFFDGDAMLDPEAKENYRNRLQELSRRRVTAEEDNDLGELDRINTEFEMIQSKWTPTSINCKINLPGVVVRTSKRRRPKIGFGSTSRMGRNLPEIRTILYRELFLAMLSPPDSGVARSGMPPTPWESARKKKTSPNVGCGRCRTRDRPKDLRNSMPTVRRIFDHFLPRLYCVW